MVMTKPEIISDLSVEALMSVARRLVGHQTNSISAALEWCHAEANLQRVERDLNRIGIFRCQNCGLWYWEDKMVDQKYCLSICRGNKE